MQGKIRSMYYRVPGTVLDSGKSKQNSQISFPHGTCIRLVYMWPRLTFLKVRFLTYEARVTITHRARVAFRGDDACVMGGENGTRHASRGVNSTAATFRRELETIPWKNK